MAKTLVIIKGTMFVIHHKAQVKNIQTTLKPSTESPEGGLKMKGRIRKNTLIEKTIVFFTILSYVLLNKI